MNTKSTRHYQIKRIILANKISSQEELLEALRKEKFELTQATLSRDLKELRVGRTIQAGGDSVYVLHEQIKQSNTLPENPGIPANSVISVVFSYHMCVIRTFPGFASTVASFVDSKVLPEIAGTIAGDDTILVIPREGYTQKEILSALGSVIPNIENNLD